ncbi:MAG: CoA-transferase [Geminicoccaceae bacterium]
MAASDEKLISVIADLLACDAHVAVGAASPIPGAAALLAQEEAKAVGRRMQVTILHSRTENHFTEGARELFDCAAQGRISSFFLGGVQIDGRANINLVGLGDYPRTKKRFAGSFGSALMYFVVPKVILFREEHSPRTLVERVDFVSAPGVSEPSVWRPGGPKALVTGRCVFAFDPGRARFRLSQVHTDENEASVRDATGFEFDVDENLSPSVEPSEQRLALLRQRIAPKVHSFYPEFAARIWPDHI